jgi:hypothetical protein
MLLETSETQTAPKNEKGCLTMDLTRKPEVLKTNI